MFSISEKKDEKFLPLFVLTKIFSLILELEKIFSKTNEGGFPLSIDKVVQKAIAYINENIQNLKVMWFLEKLQVFNTSNRLFHRSFENSKTLSVYIFTKFPS